jgi:hypothetical protein
MSNIKARLKKLEALTPKTVNGVKEIHRVIVGQPNADGSPKVIIRTLKAA